MSVWGVYNLQGKANNGSHVSAGDRSAVRWFIRWRVDGDEHKRTFKQKGHARTFLEALHRAEVLGWAADQRGWPIDPGTATPAVPTPARTTDRTFERYCLDVWWPTLERDFGVKNRQGHRRNMLLAIELLRYPQGDPRLLGASGTRAGQSIAMTELRADDLRAAIARRRTTNKRTANASARRIARGASLGQTDFDLPEELSAPSTVRAFFITLSMIVKAAIASDEARPNCLDGVAAMAPKPRRQPPSARLVPNIQQIWALSEAIAELGPPMSDGQPAGERYRSLVLVGGTAGPRPGELAGHRIEWFDHQVGGDIDIVFKGTEQQVYDTRAGISGRLQTGLKHRDEEDERPVPLLPEVAEVLAEHLRRGYGHRSYTWSSPTGTAPLSWGNLLEVYWRPACKRVFGGTASAHLVDMSPKMLRKAAVTYWLESGIRPDVAAEWAGHSVEVLQGFYAGRNKPTHQHEIHLLRAAMRPSAKPTATP